MKVGDKEPTFIEKAGNRIYVNFADKGLAEFDITSPDFPQFIKTTAVNNCGGHIQPFHILSGGGNIEWQLLVERYLCL